MPEIAEVARITHFLNRHLVGLTITSCTAIEDSKVFLPSSSSSSSSSTSPSSTFQTSLLNKKILSAGSQGKYFWLILDGNGPHPLFHFGMTGWMHIKGIQTGYTRYVERNSDKKEEWPPKFWKFHLEASAIGGKGKDKRKESLAFTDPRRFGRIRLIYPPSSASPSSSSSSSSSSSETIIRSLPPLSENGPDPVIDRVGKGNGKFTESYLTERLSRRHVPVKSFLLDQSEISGIGNWVGDEVLFQARLHPEEYSDELDDEEKKLLYEKVCEVCDTAVGCLGDSDRFPEDWIFGVRWGKGKKKGKEGEGEGKVKVEGGGEEKIEWVTVGGRTSCFVPGLQKRKNKNKNKMEKGGKGKGKGKREVKEVKEEEEEEEGEEEGETESRFFEGKGKGSGTTTKKGGKRGVKKEEEDEVEGERDEEGSRPGKRVKTTMGAATATAKKAGKKSVIKKEDEEEGEKEVKVEDTGRRRSSRLRGGI